MKKLFVTPHSPETAGRAQHKKQRVINALVQSNDPFEKKRDGNVIQTSNTYKILNDIENISDMMLRKKRIITIAIDGQIAAGKTTIADLLHERFVQKRVKVFRVSESVEESHGLFELYCSDMKKYGFLFQMWILENKVRQMVSRTESAKNDDHIVLLMDRSFQSDKEVFCARLHEEGIIDHEQWDTYEKAFHHFENMLGDLFVPDVCLQLEICPDVAIERIKKRNRSGECVYDVDFLRKIDTKYNEMYTRQIENCNELSPVSPYRSVISVQSGHASYFETKCASKVIMFTDNNADDITLCQTGGMSCVV